MADPAHSGRANNSPQAEGMNRRRFLGTCLAAAGGTLLSDRLAAAATASTGKTLPRGWHEARHWQKLDEQRVRCQLCPKHCQVADRERGYCGVRENRQGVYYTLVYGEVCAYNPDPIEKKPLFHYLPGTRAFSIATAGCNMECKYCQNWDISQFRPEQLAKHTTHMPPEEIVRRAKTSGCPTIAYTYSEPVVFFELMYDTAVKGRKAGLGSVMITNGFIERKPMEELCGVLTAVKVDFKAFSEEFYQNICSGHLQPVLDTLQLVHSKGVWLELVVLVVPSLNDSDDEFKRMSRWVLKNLGPDVPIHFSRFHGMYKLKNLPPTPVSTLERARRIAMDTGLHYVYLGNVSPHPAENTYCPGCGKEIISRFGFIVAANRLVDGRCPNCGREIPGVWKQPV